MRTFKLIAFCGLILVVLYQKYGNVPPVHQPEPTTHDITEQTDATPSQVDPAVPDKAIQVLAIIRRTGEAPEGYVGGRVFQNREHRLPAGGDYREFDVDPHDRHQGRNAERLIVEWDTKKAWYTGDHYRTFIPLP